MFLKYLIHAIAYITWNGTWCYGDDIFLSPVRCALLVFWRGVVIFEACPATLGWNRSATDHKFVLNPVGSRRFYVSGWQAHPEQFESFYANVKANHNMSVMNFALSFLLYGVDSPPKKLLFVFFAKVLNTFFSWILPVL